MVCLLPGLVTPKPANVGDSELYMWPMGHKQFERLCISAWQLGYRVAALVSAALGVDWATLPTTMLNTNATAHHEHQSKRQVGGNICRIWLNDGALNMRLATSGSGPSISEVKGCRMLAGLGH